MGFYALLALHAYAYFTIIVTVLKRRLGTTFGMIWVAIGLILLYNITFNHFFATFIKAGSPSDLKVWINALFILENRKWRRLGRRRSAERAERG